MEHTQQHNKYLRIYFRPVGAYFLHFLGQDDNGGNVNPCEYLEVTHLYPHPEKCSQGGGGRLNGYHVHTQLLTLPKNSLCK